MRTSEAYPRLYHYTTEQGLYGILENRCLWATHYKFLNDYSEIVLFKDKLIEFLYPSSFNYGKDLIPKYPNAQKVISDNGGLEAAAKHYTESFVKSCYGALELEFYISSFCGVHPDTTDRFIKENGLLSQWRAYGGGGGFAIVFKTLDLEKMLDLECAGFHHDMMHISDVVFSDDKKEFEQEFSDQLRTLECASRFKHCGFKEEKEVRIVAIPTTLNKEDRETAIRNLGEKAGDERCDSKLEKERKFRDSNGKRTPYIELFRSLKTPLPIVKIFVGPHKDQVTRAAALRIKLRDTDIEVRTSKIPYQ